MKEISGHIVDVINKKIFNGILRIENNKIVEILPVENVIDQFIMPGFIDAHIHIESSMMLPSEFARYSFIHGTIACVCDPHEIANVCGVEGINYMIDNAKNSPMKFYFGAPSCVPSTVFETSGAIINDKTVTELLARNDIYFLAEMMNYPGVINKNVQVHSKLNAAKNANKPIDGHAPGLVGNDLIAYANAGISTDHECMTLDEAELKIALGLKVIIREGSAAKNFDDLLPLITKHSDNIMFCSDDKHPDDLLGNGHINSLVIRAIEKGYNLMDVLKACTLNPVKHYNLNVGLLQQGDTADFIIVDNLKEFNILAAFIDGNEVVKNSLVTFPRYLPFETINNFNVLKISENDLEVEPTGEYLKVISVENGQLQTKLVLTQPKIEDNNIVSDVENDVLKLVVYNRYRPSTPSIGFIKNIGLKQGALASTVSHDSHNIVAVGVSDNEISIAINKIIDSKGGILASRGDETWMLQLGVGGLMSDDEGIKIATKYKEVDRMAKIFGSTLDAPFMTLAFMSLLVIPELKLGDIGLFDGNAFCFTDLME